MTFLATWRCASDFLNMLPKFKMAARGQLRKILWAQKLQNLEVRNYSNFTITFPSIWRCAGDLVLLIFKMDATDQFQFFFECAKNLKVVNYSNVTITFPTIWRCACDFFKVYGN